MSSPIVSLLDKEPRALGNTTKATNTVPVHKLHVISGYQLFYQFPSTSLTTVLVYCKDVFFFIDLSMVDMVERSSTDFPD